MKKYLKILLFIVLLLLIFISINFIYNSFFNTNYKYLQEKVLKVVEEQNYIDFKDIIPKDWEKMYILSLEEDIDGYSQTYDIDFSTINLPYRDRAHYQLVIFYKDNEIVRYGYLTKDRVVIQINSEEDILVLRDHSKFKVITDNNYKYILFK